MKECVYRTCGKKFTARNVNGVYCSAACRKKSERNGRRKLKRRRRRKEDCRLKKCLR